MKEERAEGVILRAIPYQECHHITTVFTHEQGLISLFVRGTHRSRHFSHAVVTPLTRADFLYTTKQSSDLFKFREAAVLDQHLNLRQDYATLELGCEMAQALLATQVQWKPAPRLYQLFLFYLNQASQTANHNALLTSFLFKVLKHEGLLALHHTCSICDTPLADAAFSGAEAYCTKHAPEGAIALNETERADLILLAGARTLRDVEQIEISPKLAMQAKNLFSSLTQ
jgi:DNA repair protein RecO (recombination protein O)